MRNCRRPWQEHHDLDEGCPQALQPVAERLRLDARARAPLLAKSPHPPLARAHLISTKVLGLQSSCFLNLSSMCEASHLPAVNLPMPCLTCNF